MREFSSIKTFFPKLKLKSCVFQNVELNFKKTEIKRDVFVISPILYIIVI